MNQSYDVYIEDKFSVANAITAISSSALTLFGLLGNSISLIVVIHSIRPFSSSSTSRSANSKLTSSFYNRAPRINCKKYLIAFLLTNILFLLVQFYSNTLNRLIYLFGVRINLVDSHNSVASPLELRMCWVR